MKSDKVRKSPALPVKIKQADQMTLARWEKFLEAQGGCYPASLAAVALRMSCQGVYQAAERGWIAFFSVGRTRWYGRRDVINYRFSVSKRFRDCRPQPRPSPENWNS